MGGSDPFENRSKTGPHLEFIDDTNPIKKPKPKTKTWIVQRIDTETVLGIIKWKGTWRRYWYEPRPDTGYDDRCMDQISAFMRNETKKHKETWK